MINVLYEDNHVLCVEKPINIPVMEDDSHDMDLLTMCKEYLKEKYQKPGNVYCGLVHRLDRPVGGVMVFAKTSKAASRLSEAVRTHQLKKEYLAILDGIPTKKVDTLEDYLSKDTRTNTVSVTDAKHGKSLTKKERSLLCISYLVQVDPIRFAFNSLVANYRSFMISVTIHIQQKVQLDCTHSA